MRVAVVTVSDEVASGADADRGGTLAASLLTDLGHETDLAVVPDDPDLIAAAVHRAIGESARAVVLCGGTGIGPRDHTVSVVKSLVSFEIPGIAEEIRRRGSSHTRQALVSREVAGALIAPGRQPAFVVAIPGSRGGVRDAFAVLADVLDYVVGQLDGDGHA